MMKLKLFMNTYTFLHVLMQPHTLFNTCAYVASAPLWQC